MTPNEAIATAELETAKADLAAAETELSAVTRRMFTMLALCVTFLIALFGGESDLAGALIARLTPPQGCEIIFPSGLEQAQ